MNRLASLLFALALIAGCGAPTPPVVTPGGSPRAWLDAPLPGATLAPGQTQLVAHASQLGGIAELEFSADGAAFARLQPTDAKQTLVTARQDWQAVPGKHRLQVRAKNAAGVWSEYAQAEVTVAGGEVVLARPATTPSPSPTPSPTATTVASPTASAQPTQGATAVQTIATPTASAATARPTTPPEAPTATSTSLPPTSTLAPPTSTATASPTLAPPTSTATNTTVPPTSTRTPTPRPTNTPTPYPKPAVGTPLVSSAVFYYGDSGCGAKTLTVNVNASDPAGISGVQLYFRLVDKAGGGSTAWSSTAMQPTPGLWTKQIDAAMMVPGYNSYLNSWFQFYVIATNGRGLQTQSQTYTNLVTLSRCTFVR